MDGRLQVCLGMLNDAVSIEYREPVRSLRECVKSDDMKKAAEIVETCFDKDHLMKTLLEKLKGKSVYKTLKRTLEGRCESKLEHVKGLSSLCTHIIIECQHGRNEYRVLLHDVYEKIGQLLRES